MSSGSWWELNANQPSLWEREKQSSASGEYHHQILYISSYRHFMIRNHFVPLSVLCQSREGRVFFWKEWQMGTKYVRTQFCCYYWWGLSSTTSTQGSDATMPLYPWPGAFCICLWFSQRYGRGWWCFSAQAGARLLPPRCLLKPCQARGVGERDQR